MSPPLSPSLSFPQKLKTACAALVFIGATAFAAGLAFAEPARVWSAFLTASLFFLFLSLGGVFFTSLQYATNAVWSVNLRRLMESFGSYLPIAFAAALAAFLGGGDALYSWLNPETVAEDSILIGKSPYLNRSFFLIRLIVFFSLWIFFAQKLSGFSLKFLGKKSRGGGAAGEKSLAGTAGGKGFDSPAAEALAASGSEAPQAKGSRSAARDPTGPGPAKRSLADRGPAFKLSIAFLAVFSISFTFFCIDFLMSLEPHWQSAVFGVYCFAGLFQSFIAALILLTVYCMRRQKALKAFVNENHLHDLGKFLFGCTIFWAYIAFSQYMLIWYANMPEEAAYYYHRSHHGWKWISLSLPVFKFAVPFLFLLPRKVKRSPRPLVCASLLILLTQYIEIYWMVYPSYDPHHIRFGLLEPALFAGFAGLFLFSLFRFLKSAPLVPLKDPESGESSAHAVHY